MVSRRPVSSSYLALSSSSFGAGNFFSRTMASSLAKGTGASSMTGMRSGLTNIPSWTWMTANPFFEASPSNP